MAYVIRVQASAVVETSTLTAPRLLLLRTVCDRICSAQIFLHVLIYIALPYPPTGWFPAISVIGARGIASASTPDLNSVDVILT